MTATRHHLFIEFWSAEDEHVPDQVEIADLMRAILPVVGLTQARVGRSYLREVRLVANVNPFTPPV